MPPASSCAPKTLADHGAYLGWLPVLPPSHLLLSPQLGKLVIITSYHLA